MNIRKFPIAEADIFMLAQAMIGGYTGSPADFPHADPVSLQNALDAFQSAQDAQIAAKAAQRAATTAKDEQLANLQELMKAQLKLSEVDCITDPLKLQKIGWSERKSNRKSLLPGHPLDVVSVSETYGAIKLDWRPADDGGAVRAYIIYRQDISLEGEVLRDWTQVAISLKSEITLTKQPRGIQLNYRVTALNPAGESMPSNNVDAVL